MAKLWPAGHLTIYLIFALNLLGVFCFLGYFERKRAGAGLSTRTREGGAGTGLLTMGPMVSAGLG